jgi:hypothetical protein
MIVYILHFHGVSFLLTTLPPLRLALPQYQEHNVNSVHITIKTLIRYFVGDRH